MGEKLGKKRVKLARGGGPEHKNQRRSVKEAAKNGGQSFWGHSITEKVAKGGTSNKETKCNRKKFLGSIKKRNRRGKKDPPNRMH